MWTLDAHAPVSLWRPDPSPAGGVLAFSTRRGGVSAPPFDTLNLGRSTVDDPAAVASNRARVLEAIGADPLRLVTAGQVHGARVVEVHEPGHVPECDALVTRSPGLVLAVTTADCMSILYSTPEAVGAAHAGWRGLAAGMAEAALDAVAARSSLGLEGLTAHFGPCIRGCCYEVGPEVAERFPSAAVREHEGALFLDLPTVARRQLERAGLARERIEDTGACTACEPARYFSHRRDQGRTGRHWGLAMRPVGS